MEESKIGAAPPAPAREKLPGFLITLAIVCFSGPIFWVALLLVKVGLKIVGSTTPECAEMNFLISSFNGVLLGAAGMAVIPSLITVGYGIVRIFTKKPYAFAAIAMGLVMAPVNMKLAYDTWVWYDGTSKEVVYEGAKDSLRAVAKAQRKYLTAHQTHAKSVAELKEDFTFMDKGAVEIIAADDKCYQARATHECQAEPVIWDSCNKGLQSGKITLFQAIP